MKKVFISHLFLFFVVFVSFAQKSTESLRLLTANLSNSACKSSEATNKRLSNRVVKRGYDIYTFSFQAVEDCAIKPLSVWIKETTTLPLSIISEIPANQIQLKKWDSLVLIAKHNGIFPYEKPPKQFKAEALLLCEINGKKSYIEVKALTKTEE